MLSPLCIDEDNGFSEGFDPNLSLDQHTFTNSSFFINVNLPYTGDAYSPVDKHKYNAEVLSVCDCDSQLPTVSWRSSQFRAVFFFFLTFS